MADQTDSLNITCDNCGQRVLSDDATCWHCGRMLAAADQSAPSSEEDERSSQSLTAVFIYGGLTAVLIIAMLLTMRALGQTPLAASTLEDQYWTAVTAQDGSYSINLPNHWDWLEKDHPTQQAQFETLVTENEMFDTAVYPLGDIAEDSEVFFIAINEPIFWDSGDQGFLTLARSQRLHDLTPEQAIDLVNKTNASLNVIEPTIEAGEDDRLQAQFVVEIPGPDGGWRCRQYFLPGPDYGYLLAACAPPANFITFLVEFEDILTTFQTSSTNLQ